MLVRGAQYGEDQRGAPPSDEDLSLGTPVLEKPKTGRPERRRMKTRHRRPGHRPQWSRGVWRRAKGISNTRSWTHGDRCPECGKRQCIRAEGAEACWCGLLVRHRCGYSLLTRTVALRGLRAGVHSTEPEGVGPDKYDETAAAMIAQLEVRCWTPFYRLEQLERQLGIPLPAATQWEIVEEAAQVIKPARDELIRQAAQGTVVHNDDTACACCG